jgi:hypothetical protein
VTLASVPWVGLRPLPLLLVFAAFLTHLVGDYFGSGAGWGIAPYLPFSRLEYVYTLSPHDILVPNLVGTGVGVLAALVIAARWGRTPLELVHAGADRLVVDAIQLRLRPTPCRWCAARAWARCAGCRGPACPTHLVAARHFRPRCATCAAD